MNRAAVGARGSRGGGAGGGGGGFLGGGGGGGGQISSFLSPFRSFQYGRSKNFWIGKVRFFSVFLGGRIGIEA